MKRFLRRLSSNHEGSIAIEFAVALPVLLLMIMGIIELGRYYYQRSVVQFAMDQTAREVMVRTTSLSNAQIEEEFYENLSGVDADAVTFSATDQTVGTSPYKALSAAYSFSFIGIGLLPLEGVAVSLQSTVPVLP